MDDAVLYQLSLGFSTSGHRVGWSLYPGTVLKTVGGLQQNCFQGVERTGLGLPNGPYMVRMVNLQPLTITTDRPQPYSIEALFAPNVPNRMPLGNENVDEQGSVPDPGHAPDLGARCSQRR